MAGLNTRATALAPDYLLGLSKTDLADLLWGIVQQALDDGQDELARITQEAQVQVRGGDKGMQRASKYLADLKAKLDVGHSIHCHRIKRSGFVAPLRTKRVGGWACVDACQANLAKQ